MMTRRLLLLNVIALLSLAAAPQTAAGEDVWLWLVGGQSNAPGLVETVDGRTPLADHLGAKYPDATHAIVLHGDSGTALSPTFSSFGPSWHPSLYDGSNDQSDSSLYGLMDKYEDQVAAVLSAGDTPRVKGLFWMQGYQDSKSGGTHPSQPDAADNYGVRLQDLIARVRQEVGVADLPVVIGETAVGPNPTYGAAAYAPQVQAAQASVALQDARVWLAETDASQLGPDDTHFTSDGHYQLAGDMVALVPEPGVLSLLIFGLPAVLRRKRFHK